MQLSLFSNAAFLTFLLSFLPLIELKGAIPFAMSTLVWGESALNFSQAFLVAFLGSSLVVPFVAFFFKKITNYLSQYKIFRSIFSFLTEDIQKRGEKFQEKQNCTQKTKDKKQKENFEFRKKNSKKSTQRANKQKVKVKTDVFKNEKTDKFLQPGQNFEKDNSSSLLQKKSRRKTLSKMLAVFLFVAFPVPLTGVWTGTALGVILDLSFFQVCIVTIFGNLVCGILVCFVCAVFPSATTIFLIVFLFLVFLCLTTRIFRRFLKNRLKK